MKILSNDFKANLPEAKEKPKGGTTSFARNFSDYLSTQGHQWVGVLSQKTESNSPIEINGPTGKKFFIIKSFSQFSFWGKNEFINTTTPDDFLKPDIVEVQKLISLTKPDLVFLNGFSSREWVLFKAAKIEGVPIAIQHAGVLAREIEAYKDLIPIQNQALALRLEREVSDMAEANIFLNQYSQSVFEKLVQPQLLNNPVIIPLPHVGWNFPLSFFPSKNEIRNLGVVARWDRIKNHRALLALAEEIVRQNLPWKIISVTTIPETSKHLEFKKKYKDLITVIPPMSKESLGDFYRSVDVLLLPSLFDVSPNVVMEALAKGRPTLISPFVGWVSEYNQCGMAKWVTDFSNPSLVIKILQSHFLRQDWEEVKCFSDYIQSVHSPSKVYDSYLDLFQKIIMSR